MRHSRLKGTILHLLILLVLSLFPLTVHAEETALDITASCKIEGIAQKTVTDGSLSTCATVNGGKITITCDEEIGAVYLRHLDKPYGTVFCEKAEDNRFLSQLFKTQNGEKSVTVYYDSAKISEITVFSKGELPKHVQVWEAGDKQTDIMLFATHSDDDQLFFAGLLPYYASRKETNVRVAYFVSHEDAPNRLHELLSGLWECGLTLYPELGIFPDAYSESFSGAVSNLEASGKSYGEVIKHQKSLIRQYRPKVIVLHDLSGEYGHGQHILNTQSVIEAIKGAGLTEKDLAEDELPLKVYVHLYDKGVITLPIDTPLSELSNLTPFAVSQNAFRHHKSQHWTWFYGWLYGKSKNIVSSREITTYNPSKYGLYFTRVGEDTEGVNDMLENVKTYAEEAREQLEQLEKERLEAERLKREKLTAEILSLETELESNLVELETLKDELSRQGRLVRILMALEVIILSFLVIVIFRRKGGKKS